MPQTHKLSKNNTTVRMEGNKTIVTLHSTDVVTVTPNSIILNTGGWETLTTKVRMNQASNQFGLGYYVFQKDYRWFVNYQGIDIPFKEWKITLNRVS